MLYPNFHPTALFAGDFPRATRNIVVASGANVAGTPLRRGTLLGRVTATDKYIPCVRTASDGSQVPAAVLTEATDAGSADVGSRAYFTGEFAGEVMAMDATWSIATLEAALRIAGSMIFVKSVGTIA